MALEMVTMVVMTKKACEVMVRTVVMVKIIVAPQRNGGCEGTVKKKKRFLLLIFDSFFILPNSKRCEK